MIIKNLNKTVIGELVGNEFRKKVRKSKHLFKIQDAWGIDALYFREVLQPNNYLIRILDLDDRTLYELSAKDFKKYGQHYHFKKGEIDHLAQIFCSRTRFKKTQYPLK